MPRRSYPSLAGRLLHDHTADRIARVVSRVPDAAATVVPFDVRHKVETDRAKRARQPAGARPGPLEDYEWPPPPPGANPIGSLCQPGRATAQGCLRAAEIRSSKPAGTGVLAWDLSPYMRPWPRVILGGKSPR